MKSACGPRPIVFITPGVTRTTRGVSSFVCRIHPAMSTESVPNGAAEATPYDFFRTSFSQAISGSVIAAETFLSGSDPYSSTSPVVAGTSR